MVQQLFPFLASTHPSNFYELSIKTLPKIYLGKIQILDMKRPNSNSTIVSEWIFYPKSTSLIHPKERTSPRKLSRRIKYLSSCSETFFRKQSENPENTIGVHQKTFKIIFRGEIRPLSIKTIMCVYIYVYK